jgi:hypothetical protein
MVDCSRFLQDYSAFRDEVLEDEVRVQFEAHLLVCPSCERYDRVISEGVRLYRKCPELEVSDDFLPRLQHRLYHVEEELKGPGRVGSGVRAALPLALAASIAAIAWIPAMRSAPTLHELPPIAARAPLPAVQPILQSGSIFTPAASVPNAWESMQASRPAADLFQNYPFQGSEARLQPVAQW